MGGGETTRQLEAGSSGTNLEARERPNEANKLLANSLNITKIMECMITERLTYFLESRGSVLPHQSGFRKGRGTMYPVLCLEAQVRKAQMNKESVVAVFF